jgi:hypothetical protein
VLAKASRVLAAPAAAAARRSGQFPSPSPPTLPPLPPPYTGDRSRGGGASASGSGWAGGDGPGRASHPAPAAVTTVDSAAQQLLQAATRVGAVGGAPAAARGRSQSPRAASPRNAGGGSVGDDATTDATARSKRRSAGGAQAAVAMGLLELDSANIAELQLLAEAVTGQEYEVRQEGPGLHTLLARV